MSSGNRDSICPHRTLSSNQPEVRDATGRADSCSGNHHHVLTATELQQPSHRGEAATGGEL